MAKISASSDFLPEPRAKLNAANYKVGWFSQAGINKFLHYNKESWFEAKVVKAVK